MVYTTCAPSDELTSGVVFCEVKSWLTGRRLVSLPFSDHCDPLVESSAEFDDLWLRVRETVDSGKWDYFEVRPFPFEPGALTMLGQSHQYHLHAIDLQPSIEEIFRKLHKSSVQRKIRRLESRALVYEEGNSERLLGHFCKLLVETRRRHQLPPQPTKWFRSLMASFGDKLKFRVAFKDGAPIASILTLDYKDTVTFKYGCSDARWHSLGGVALLLWTTIQQSKAAGYKKFDLGRTDVSNAGLTTFKERWGGIRSGLNYWRYPNHPPSREMLWKKTVAGCIAKVASDRLLTAAGNLLYRHIG